MELKKWYRYQYCSAICFELLSVIGNIGLEKRNELLLVLVQEAEYIHDEENEGKRLLPEHVSSMSNSLQKRTMQSGRSPNGIFYECSQQMCSTFGSRHISTSQGACLQRSCNCCRDLHCSSYQYSERFSEKKLHRLFGSSGKFKLKHCRV